MEQQFQDVTDMLSLYFDGLYHSDTDRLRQVFHPQSSYICATDEPMVHLTMDDYFPIVDQREAPADRNEERRDRIVSIQFAGPSTAFAVVNCAIGPKYFTDFLTLVLTGGRWQIISKVFHYDII